MKQSRNKADRNSSLKKYIVADRYDGMTTEEYVKDVMQESSRHRQKLFFSKGVYVNGKIAHSKRIIKAGDMVAIRQFKDSSYGVVPEAGEVEVLYEDNELIILNKPAGMLVHPGGQTNTGTLANYLAMYFKDAGKVVTIRAIHRLDRDTTGCVIFAKSGVIQTKLEKMMAEGKIHRQYEAVVCGTDLDEKYPDGTINLPIGKDPLKPNRRLVTPKGQVAITHFTVEKKWAKNSLLSLQLETGRTHQIRVHLANGGCPVYGDRMYGEGVSQKLIKRQALHAVAVELQHPLTEEVIKVKAPRPEDFVELLAELNKD